MDIHHTWTGTAEDLLSQVTTLLDRGSVASEYPLSCPNKRSLLRLAEKGVIDQVQGDRYSRRHLLQCLLMVKLTAAGWTASQMADFLPSLSNDELAENISNTNRSQLRQACARTAKPAQPPTRIVNATATQARPHAHPSRPGLTARLLAAGVLQQYQQVREHHTPVVHNELLPPSLRQAMALLGRLRIDEGKADHSGSLHQVLARCTEPLGSPTWGIEAFRTPDFDFSHVRLIDPYHRCPTRECIELSAGIGANHRNARQHIEEAMSFDELRTQCARFGARRDTAYTLIREFIGRNPLVTPAEIEEFVHAQHIGSAEDFLRGCWIPPDTRHQINGRLFQCTCCETPLERHGGAQGRCPQRLCSRFHVPVPLHDPVADGQRLRVLAPHLMTYWYGPAIDELRVYDHAIERGLQALLYPSSDACDISIGETIGIDVKSYHSPQLLGLALNQSIGGLERYARRIVAISDIAAASCPSYLSSLRRSLGANPHGLEVMRVSQLLRVLESMA